MHWHPLLVPAGIASCNEMVDAITLRGHYEYDLELLITIIKLIHINSYFLSLLVTVLHLFKSMKIMLQKKSLLKYEESTQFQKVKLSSLYLTRLFYL